MFLIEVLNNSYLSVFFFFQFLKILLELENDLGEVETSNFLILSIKIIFLVLLTTSPSYHTSEN